MFGEGISAGGDGWPSAGAVAAAFGLEGHPGELVPVAGAWSNRLFRLVVGAEAFAVKELRNPWHDARWLEWLEAAWAFELAAIAAGVDAPEPLPNPETGHCLAWVERDGDDALVPVRVHRWVDGQPADPGPVGLDVARWAGRTLATLHGLAIRPSDRSVFPKPNTDTADHWPDLIEAAQRAKEPWADQPAQVADAVMVIAELARAGGHHPDEEVMTHGDVDQKNLVLGVSGPVLCDWDMAVPLVPRRELADAALSLGAWVRTDIAHEVVATYCDASGSQIVIEPADLGQSMMTGLDWIAFNVQRAIGLRDAEPAEADTARHLVPALLNALPHQVDVALRVSETLIA